MTTAPRFVLITSEDAKKIVGDAGAKIDELAGIMYKKLGQGVENTELVTLEFDFGRAREIASRRGAALDYIAELLEDLHRLDSPTAEEIRITLDNIYTIQLFS